MSARFSVALVCLLLSFLSSNSFARGEGDCRHDSRPAISFIEFPSADLLTQQRLTVKGKLTLPVTWQSRRNCFAHGGKLAAVLILHGSSGVDARGEFHARALNAADIATLEIDMWEARGVTGAASRPPLPYYTYPDAFAALAFLAAQPGIDADRIGVLGFSWGGVVAMAAATQNVSAALGGGHRFKAHAANYPVCYAYNNPRIPNSSFGANAANPLTGAPILIQIGSLDDYDDGADPCLALKAGLTADEQELVEVVAHDGAYHAWDRLMVPTTAADPFAHRGLGGTIHLVPDVDQAYESRNRIVRFFLRKL